MRAQGERKIRVVILILLLIVFFLTYIYFFFPRGGQSLIEASPESKNNIQFLMAIYGPGPRSNFPYFWRPLGVTTDVQGRIYVADTNNHRVCVFSNKGLFNFEFGRYGPDLGDGKWQGGMFNRPYGVAVSEDGRIYVADMFNGRIQIFDHYGRFIDYFPKIKSIDPSNPFHALMLRPRDIAIYKDKLYVCDSFRVAIFDLNGNLIGSLGTGKIGAGPGDLKTPNGIAIGPDGTIYVSDSNNFRIQAFSPEGKVKWIAPQIGVPRGLGIDKKGNLLVVNAINSNILVFSPKGKYLGLAGGFGEGKGEFIFPNDLAVQPNGDTIIADKDNNRIQIVRVNY